MPPATEPRIADPSLSQAELRNDTMVITRLINAPRALVFRAWSHAEHLARWWGPFGFTTTTQHFDFRPGGEWRLIMHGPDGRDYVNRLSYIEILTPERIVYEHSGDETVNAVRFRNIITFEDEAGQTRVTLSATFASRAEAERVMREYGALEGGRETLARLANTVEPQDR